MFRPSEFPCSSRDLICWFSTLTLWMFDEPVCVRANLRGRWLWQRSAASEVVQAENTELCSLCSWNPLNFCEKIHKMIFWQLRRSLNEYLLCEVSVHGPLNASFAASKGYKKVGLMLRKHHRDSHSKFCYCTSRFLHLLLNRHGFAEDLRDGPDCRHRHHHRSGRALPG